MDRASTSPRVVRILRCVSRQQDADGKLAGHWVSLFNPNGKLDPGLTALEKYRFRSWLHLRAALEGKTATQKDQDAACEKMTAILRGVLPSTIALAKQQPVGEPRTINTPQGKAQVWETSFRLDDESVEAKCCRELRFAGTASAAYEYWTFLVLQQARMAEWKGRPAILCCGKHGAITSLEVAHYVATLLNHRPTWCLRCGNLFVSKRSDAEYCGDACRWADQKAKQRKKRRSATLG
jgi:hypothetical protein